MNYNKQTVKDVPLSGKKVLLRCDFNVPQDKTTGEITSDKRIVAALPTIRYLLDHGAAVIALFAPWQAEGHVEGEPYARSGGQAPDRAAWYGRALCQGYRRRGRQDQGGRTAAGSASAAGEPAF